MRTKIILMMFFLAVFSVNSQELSTQKIVSDCVTIEVITALREPVYSYKLVTAKNGTKYNESTYLYDKVSDVKTFIDKCKPLIQKSDGAKVDFRMQNFNCFNDGKNIICDSCIDGNCDGKCSSGETCCMVVDDNFKCKNSVDSWNTESGLIVVAVLQ